MTSFDRIFFSRYVKDGSKIHYVFHRHIILILEVIVLWLLFAVILPAFFYFNNSFSIRESIDTLTVSFYLMGVYMITMYLLFDWYNDVWIATENEIIAIRWKLITQDALYTEYEKIEGIEVRTQNWWYALIGASDVVIKLAGDDSFTLAGASRAAAIVGYIKECAKGKENAEESDDREPFEILIDTLTDVVKGSLGKREGELLTSEYVKTLDSEVIKE